MAVSENTSLDIVTVSGVCQTHGPWERRAPKFLADREIPCPTCSEVLIAKRKADEAEAAKQAAERRRVAQLADLGVNERHIGKTFDTFIAENPEQAKALRVCRDLAERVATNPKRAPSLLMCGNPGTGKTHLACAIVQHLFDTRHTASKVSMSGLIRSIKETWRKGSEIDEADMLRHYANLDLLLIDEVGTSFGSDTERMFLFDIIDRRYEACLATVLISNLDIERLRSEVGDRVLDRLREDGGKLLTFTGKSWRNQA